MNAMTQGELDQFVEELNQFSSADLRQFRYDEAALQFQMESRGRLIWVTLSLKPGNPICFYSLNRTFLVKNLKKPFQLFIKTHFVDAQFKGVRRINELGRVLEFVFGKDGEELKIDFRLIPGRVNIGAHAFGKEVFVNKPKDLQEQGGELKASTSENRENSFFEDFWSNRFSNKKPNENKESKKELKKKQSGLKKMEEKLVSLQEDSWRKLGENLNNSQSLEAVPDDLKGLVDPSLSIHENIEKAFSMSKKNVEKIKGTEERITVLKKEIAALESGEGASKKKATVKESLLSTAQAKGRTLSFPEGRVFIGKSGPENLKLLRKAKPWYLWFHIKDYPGAYGIFEKNKNSSISENSLKEASLAVVKQSLPKGAQGNFEVIYAECRYVRPIKGAKSGQVTYSHEKVLPIKVEE